MKRKEWWMSFQIQDAALEARIQKQVENIGARSVEEALVHLLETQEEQDRWLRMNRESIGQGLQLGFDQLDLGEGIPEDELDEYLAKLKSQPE